MKIGFRVERCTHVLFQCPEYVNEITKNHTKAVSDEFCVISLFLLKLIKIVRSSIYYFRKEKKKIKIRQKKKKKKIDFRGYVTF